MSKRKPRPVTMSRVPQYKWDDERGGGAIGTRNDTQAIQLLHGPASMAFRRHCGLLLVDALNAEVRNAACKSRKGAKR